MHAYTSLLSTDREIGISIEFLELLTAGYHKKDFAVRLWDGTIWGNVDSPRFTLILNHPGALRGMFLSPSELTLGEAFIYDDFDIEGDIEGMFALGDFLLNRNYSLVEKLKLGSLIAALPETEFPVHRPKENSLTGSLHSKERDRHAIAFHYDVSNDFYSLWLDRSMSYSCAYFRSLKDSLDTAQESKLDYICRKLRLRPGDRLLDVGCGWGGLAIYAAKHFGADAFGITLSVSQAEEARERIRAAGLGERCKVEMRDYRELDPAQGFDKIVSVGMFEHVGEKLLPEYFQRIWNILRPGGVFLNHGIAQFATFQRQGPSFIDKYVFPGGELVPLNTTLRAAEECGFEVRDVESLREHYALTLSHWVRRLEAKATEAKKIVKEVKYRIWRLYMAGSAHGFISGRLNVYQVLLGKFGHGHSPLPLTREDWYA
jgi:cyclopropane-fatty-acyl-phospholipid synthase